MDTIMKAIELKGTKDGPVINVKEALDYESTEIGIKEFISANIKFFEGVDFIDLSLPYLKSTERNKLLKSLENDFPIRFNIITQRKKIDSKKVQKDQDNSIIVEERYKPSKFIRATIRSGSSVEFEGNVIVLGDVNPGAQIIAGGNIVVMGYLRGVAHAGSKGDEKAFVSANRLEPIQLRIANYIAISPEDTKSTPKGCRIAYIHEGTIMIEDYPARG